MLHKSGINMCGIFMFRLMYTCNNYPWTSLTHERTRPNKTLKRYTPTRSTYKTGENRDKVKRGVWKISMSPWPTKFFGVSLEHCLYESRRKLLRCVYVVFGAICSQKKSEIPVVSNRKTTPFCRKKTREKKKSGQLHVQILASV